MNLGKSLNCFKVYDIRGKIGEELNEEIAYRIGRATTQILDAKSVVVGFDARATSLCWQTCLPEAFAKLVLMFIN